jgi:hypothetical protein
MSQELQPDGTPIDLGGTLLRTPGLAGTAEWHPRQSARLRSARSLSEILESALAGAVVDAQQVIEINQAHEIRMGGLSTRSTRFGEPAIVVEPPEPGEAQEQFVLATDEAGVMTWNFAEHAGPTGARAARGSGRRRYLVRRFVARPDGATRGLIGSVGKKLLQVLVFPLVDPLLGAVGDYFALRWEQRKRPYWLRTFTPEDYDKNDGAALAAADWPRLASGRALLFVHGTFSRAHAGFAGLPREFMVDLHKQYDGRVFAFDHYTISEDPQQNVRWMLENIPQAASLELDIICHSRGGLVSRALAEKQSEFSLGSARLSVRKVILVGTPNAGTPLADTVHMGDLIDSYSNMMNFFPDTAATLTVEGIVTVVKQLAADTMKGLEGLQCMVPSSEFLRNWLNCGTGLGVQYYAIASDFRPTNPGLAAYVGDRLFQKIFCEAANDLVVPTEGVYQKNGSGLFPIEERHVFGPGENVTHGGYFCQANAVEKIRGWLAEQ